MFILTCVSALLTIQPVHSHQDCILKSSLLISWIPNIQLYCRNAIGSFPGPIRIDLVAQDRAWQMFIFPNTKWDPGDIILHSTLFLTSKTLLGINWHIFTELTCLMNKTEQKTYYITYLAMHYWAICVFFSFFFFQVFPIIINRANSQNAKSNNFYFYPGIFILVMHYPTTTTLGRNALGFIPADLIN